jgi:CRISPR-associated protein Cas1
MDGANSELNNKTKGELLRVLFADVVMGKQTRPLEVALSFTSASLLKVYKGEVSKLTLPELQ